MAKAKYVQVALTVVMKVPASAEIVPARCDPNTQHLKVGGVKRRLDVMFYHEGRDGEYVNKIWQDVKGVEVVDYPSCHITPLENEPTWQLVSLERGPIPERHREENSASEKEEAAL